MCLMKHILLACMTGVLVNHGRLEAIGLHAQFCGYEQKCAGNGTDVKDSCCQPCECEDICKERNTCCNDKIGLNDTGAFIKQECRAAVYRQQGFPYSKRFNSYYTRTSCPDFFKDAEIRNKCENNHANYFEYITPVSSENGTIVYKNRFCGICHSEKRTIGWKMIISEASTDKCRGLLRMKNMTADLLKEYILSFCTITFKRPSNLDYQSTTCIDSSLLTNKCNITGKWEVYDGEIEHLCQHPQESGYYFSNAENRVYSSLYCYLCNTKANITRSICPARFDRFIGEELVTLINQNVWTNPEEMKSTTRCMTNQVLDTFFNYCSQLYCPQFSLPFHGSCVAFMAITRSYHVNVRLIPLELIDISESVRRELRSRFLSIKSKLGFGKCDFCYVFFFLEKGSSREKSEKPRLIYMEFGVTPTERCKLEHIWAVLISIQRSKYIRILLNKKEILFQALWNERQIFDEDQYELLLSNSGAMCPITRPLRGTTCPRVKLTIEDYETVQKNHSKADKLLFSPNQEDINGTIFVCYDNFYRFEERSTGVQKHASVTLATLAILVAGFISVF